MGLCSLYTNVRNLFALLNSLSNIFGIWSLLIACGGRSPCLMYVCKNRYWLMMMALGAAGFSYIVVKITASPHKPRIELPPLSCFLWALAAVFFPPLIRFILLFFFYFYFKFVDICIFMSVSWCLHFTTIFFFIYFMLPPESTPVHMQCVCICVINA